MMDNEEFEQRRDQIARSAKEEGAWYYDPDSPTLWKRFVLGPVPLWRRPAVGGLSAIAPNANGDTAATK
jgi:hypothetical protein